MYLEIKKFPWTIAPLRSAGTVKLLTMYISSFCSKEYNLQELGEGGDGSEVGGCIEDDGLLDLDHPGVPLLLVRLAYEYVCMKIYVQISN